jgi:hypothetical protein
MRRAGSSGFGKIEQSNPQSEWLRLFDRDLLAVLLVELLIWLLFLLLSLDILYAFSLLAP